MKKNEKLNLDEALKQFYSDEPLKIKLSASVADKVFAKQKTTVPAADKWALYCIVVAGSVLIIFLIRYMVQLKVNPVLLLLLLPVLAYYWLSAKEISMLSRKYMQLS